MAFIKNSRPSVGDKVVLQKEHSSLSGVFEAGTEVTIIGIGERGYDIKDEYGNQMIECGWEL